MTTRTLKVDVLARVEGEGALTIRYKGDEVRDVKLRIYEPPRFFEAFLRGRSHLEVPDVTARICGICPVAYQMSGCNAVEAALGVAVDPAVRALRRLLYCGEWIESHVLHTTMLHAPDFLGYPDAIAMAREHKDAVLRGLRMKKAGNTIVATLGGREIHPINVRIGGFYRAPSRTELEALVPELTWGAAAAREALRWMAGFDFPEFERDYEFVALRHPDEYAITEGRIVSSRGIDIAVDEFDHVFEEVHVAHSNALHAIVRGRADYFCGPLARLNLSFDRLPAPLQALAREVGVAPPCRNPYRGLLARGVEVAFAFDEALRLIAAYRAPERPYVEAPAKAGVGHGCTEAPRGILYHRYAVDARGDLADARIVPPTSQNQRCIEADLWQLAPRLHAMADEPATWLAEQAVRNYDPCISCATHFLTLRREEDDT